MAFMWSSFLSVNTEENVVYAFSSVLISIKRSAFLTYDVSFITFLILYCDGEVNANGPKSGCDGHIKSPYSFLNKGI